MLRAAWCCSRFFVWELDLAATSVALACLSGKCAAATVLVEVCFSVDEMVELAACAALSGSVAADSVDQIVIAQIHGFGTSSSSRDVFSQRWFSAQIIAGEEGSNACRNGSLNSSLNTCLDVWSITECSSVWSVPWGCKSEMVGSAQKIVVALIVDFHTMRHSLCAFGLDRRSLLQLCVSYQHLQMVPAVWYCLTSRGSPLLHRAFFWEDFSSQDRDSAERAELRPRPAVLLTMLRMV